MITKLISDFAKVSNNNPDKVFEFIMDFDTMDGVEFLCAEHSINIMLSIPDRIFVSVLTLSTTDTEHCIYIMPKQLIKAFDDYPDILERYFEFYQRLVHMDINPNPDIPTLDFCYADVVKVFNCAELLQQYYASMVAEIKFGL